MFEQALREAVQLHFCKLFDVLMSGEINEPALKRFEKGLDKVEDAATSVNEILKQRGWTDAAV